jgi:MFS family permease
MAYVADITEKENRASACGLVSATFAASLVTSPALGAYISTRYSDDVVVLVASIIFILDILFIMFFVRESIQPKKEKKEYSDSTSPVSPIASQEVFSWQSVDPFTSLRIIAKDATVLQLAMVVFLSNLPEAGQFSCFFVYLKLVSILGYIFILF